MNDKYQILNEQMELVNESFIWIPSTLYVHKLVKQDDFTFERLNILKEHDIIEDTNNMHLVSYIHPDTEFCMSMLVDRFPQAGSDCRVFFAYMDPKRIVINQRMPKSGFGIESISRSEFKTSMLMTGGNATFKLLEEAKCEIISTNIPIIAMLIVGLYENYRVRFTGPNKLGASFMRIRKVTGGFFLTDVLFKSLRYYKYRMVVK